MARLTSLSVTKFLPAQGVLAVSKLKELRKKMQSVELSAKLSLTVLV